jgi:hypothetical protein
VVVFALAPPPVVDQHALPGIVADARTGQVAYLTSSTKLAVRHTTGPAETFTVGSECEPAAVTVGAVGLNCGASAVVLPTNGHKAIPVPVPGATETALVALGKRWVEVFASGGGATRDIIVDRQTDAIIDLAKDPFGRHDALDLDLVSPVDKICAGAKRSAGTDGRRFAPSTVIGGRFVEGGRIYDCDTGKTLKLPATAQVDATSAAYRKGGKVTLVRLASRKRTSYSAKSFALSSTGLWLQKGSGALSVVPLSG